MARLLKVLSRWGLAQRIQPYLPPLNFISIHYLYFVGTCLLTSVIFYCTSTPAFSISYTDCLYLVISAMTEAGLNTVNLSVMNTFQQWLLWMHIICGGAIFVSISVVHIRKRAFEKRFGDLLKAQRDQIRKRRSTLMETHHRSLARVVSTHGEQPTHDKPSELNSQETKVEQNGQDVGLGDIEAVGNPESARTLQNEPRMDAVPNSNQNGPSHISFVPETSFASVDSKAPKRRASRAFSFTGVGASPVATTSFIRPRQLALNARRPDQSEQNPRSFFDSTISRSKRKFLTREVTGRNSQFHSLTLAEREQLGGVEYRAITLLSWVVPAYFFLWQLLGCLSVGAWMAYNARDITEANGINPWWNGAFNAVSAFNNSGMSLLDLNMIPFQTSTFPVFTMGLLILAGNTAYPVFLRLILWTMYRLIPDTPYYYESRNTIKFVLDHPRRVYTNLFPSVPTWWLLLTLIVLNGIDWVAFELLNIGNDVVTSIPAASRVLDGLFQALAVRSGGFYIVPIASLRIGVQLLYVFMMYISVYPVVITMRNSNVYEERSLGIYAEDSAEEAEKTDAEIGRIGRFKRSMTLRTKGESRGYFIRQQVRGQLAHDLLWLCIAILLITCIETSSFQNDPVTYSVFNVIFEVVSGYGCVGITTGLPDQAYSFSGGWHVVSKLILCAVMLRGRHRGLPVAIDRAVLLPQRSLNVKEEEDYEIRRGRSMERTGQEMFE